MLHRISIHRILTFNLGNNANLGVSIDHLTRKIHHQEADPAAHDPDSRVGAHKHQGQELELVAKHHAMHQRAIQDERDAHGDIQEAEPIE